MKKFLLIPLVFILLPNLGHSQELETKFGKITKAELEMNSYSLDTSASAVILFDVGNNTFSYSVLEGFILQFNRHVRIKILKKEGYDYANLEIPLYYSGSDEESLSSFKAFIYNLKEGEINKEKVTWDDGEIDVLNKHWKIAKFAMPNVKVGSVIEFQYCINTDFFFNLRDWQLQSSIPVMYSDYKVVFPEYFWYNEYLSGYVLLSAREHYTESESVITGTMSSERDKMGATTSMGMKTLNYTNHIYHFQAMDVPALKEEPYMPEIDNYYGTIKFELSYIQLPNTPRRDYTESWEDINRFLKDDTQFGLQLNRSKFARELTEPIIATVSDSLMRAKTIFEKIKERMKWNEMNSYYTTTDLRTAYEERHGNSADINLMLVSLFRDAGLQAWPVLVSTRNHGFIIESRPALNQFNYVIAMARINGKEYFFDATSKKCPAGLLPSRCMNGKGRIIDAKEGGWIEILPNGSRKRVVYTTVELTESAGLKGKLSQASYDYEAFKLREVLIDQASQDDYINEIISDHPGLDITTFTFTNLDSIYLPVKMECDMEWEDYAQSSGERIYLNPMLGEEMQSNPFNLEKRIFPVDFIYPFEVTIVNIFQVPSTYSIESIPVNAAIKLPNGIGSFIYNCSLVGGNLNISSRLLLNKALVRLEDYPYLKEFYNQIVTKQSEMIVLKKNT